MSLLVSAFPSPPADDRPHLAVAIDAARFIQASAVATPNGTTWPANPADRTSVAADLYSGSAGVVLFFVELHRATGDPAHLATATAGADELLASLDRQADAGLYTGLAGIGFVLSEVGRHTATAKYRDGARRVVALLQQRAVERGAGIQWNDTTDIISGLAGIGLFLLYAAEALDSPEARTLAARAGRRLLERGRDESGGRKWPMDGTSAQLLPNFSHGTAGVAYFLATLYQATKDRAFLDGALAGAAYLKAIANTDGDVCLIYHHEPDEAGRRLYHLGWCHGPAGTARLWYRLWQATGDRAWLEWASKSARGIVASGVPDRPAPGFWNNVGAVLRLGRGRRILPRPPSRHRGRRVARLRTPRQRANPRRRRSRRLGDPLAARRAPDAAGRDRRPDRLDAGRRRHRRMVPAPRRLRARCRASDPLPRFAVLMPGGYVAGSAERSTRRAARRADRPWSPCVPEGSWRSSR